MGSYPDNPTRKSRSRHERRKPATVRTPIHGEHDPLVAPPALSGVLMANEWVSIRVNLPRSPEVSAMANHLASVPEFISWLTDGGVRNAHEIVSDVTLRYVTVTGLSQVWGVANERGYMEGDDLVLPFATLDSLDALAGVPGFGSAMALVEWAITRAQQGVTFPRFRVYNKPHDEVRKKNNRARQARYRLRKREEEARKRGATVTSRGATVTPPHDTTLQNTEEKAPPIIPPKTDWERALAAGAGSILNTAAFRIAWESWCTYRRERHKPLTPSTIKRQIAKLERMGHDQAIEAIEISISNGWTGLFEPKEPEHGRAPKTGSGKTDRPRRLLETEETIIPQRYQKPEP